MDMETVFLLYKSLTCVKWRNIMIVRETEYFTL